MTVTEIKRKINELELFLKNNSPTHPNYTLINKDKQQLEKQLKELENGDGYN